MLAANAVAWVPTIGRRLQGYIPAFEDSDASALSALLVVEASLEAPPVRQWVKGLATCLPYLRAHSWAGRATG